MTIRRTNILSLAAAAALLLTTFFCAQPAPAQDIPDAELYEVHTFDHQVRVGAGNEIRVTAHFTLAALLREPARAALFLTGPEFRGNFWSIPVEGYNGPAMAAKRGFIAYTYDYVGVGESSLPEDGSEINYLTQVKPARKLIKFIRSFWGVDKVDLIGEGYGAEIASELADEPQWVRSVTMSTVTYQTYSAGILGFFNSDFEAFLRSFEDGYFEPAFLDLTLQFSPDQELRDYVFATQQGSYPTGPALTFWDMPGQLIDAAAAQVPGLVIMGEFDPFPAAGDSAALAADWGGGASLVTIYGGVHVPRIEAPEIADQYFEALFDFIDP